MKDETCSTLAKASALAPFVAVLGACLLNFGLNASQGQSNPAEANPDDMRLMKFLVGLFPLLLVVAGIGSGIVALVSANRRKQKGIVLPAVIGIVLGILFLAFVAFVFVIVAQMVQDGRIRAR